MNRHYGIRQYARFELLGCALIIAFFAVVIATPGSAKSAKVDKQAKATFESSCAGCHGVDGAGTALGKSLQAADLRSAAVQKIPSGELVAAVTNGKGNMPPFKDKLNPEQIKAVIGYVRTLGSAKATGK